MESTELRKPFQRVLTNGFCEFTMTCNGFGMEKQLNFKKSIGYEYYVCPKALNIIFYK